MIAADDLEQKVTRAMENRELKVYYQPQYDALGQHVESAEALVRWITPDGGVIMPGEFIPTLEETDAIVRVDWYMAEEVCRFLKGLRERGLPLLPVSVNFSRWHIYEETVAERLSKLADDYGIDHGYIVVEITESALLEDRERICAMLLDLREQGFHISIDDFGSGLSSLSFVKDVPADELKIDKSLLDKNCEDEKERVVLESIFLFANRLKMTTVAEGVETKEQLGFLRTCNCRKIQGFYYDKPLPEDTYIQRLCECTERDTEEDILAIQTPAASIQLLLEAVYMRYPLIIYANLSRNSYYMMTYENYTARSCPAAGKFDELIIHGAQSMHPEDAAVFEEMFCAEHQLACYREGQRELHLVTRQRGDDGVYRKVETSNYFVKNPASKDILVISLCNNI